MGLSMEIVIASSNLHKIREFRDMLKPFVSLDVLSLLNFSSYTPPAETGTTFQENATLKAEHAALSLQKWVLADDSGLSVPALSGAPGVHSRRYSGEDGTDAENRKKLLLAMKNFSDFERTASFECCLVLASPEGIKKVVMGSCEGTIAKEERGRHGFGYDSIFIKNEYDKTFGELEEAVKNRVSHRSKAFEKLRVVLENIK